MLFHWFIIGYETLDYNLNVNPKLPVLCVWIILNVLCARRPYVISNCTCLGWLCMIVSNKKTTRNKDMTWVQTLLQGLSCENNINNVSVCLFSIQTIILILIYHALSGFDRVS